MRYSKSDSYRNAATGSLVQNRPRAITRAAIARALRAIREHDGRVSARKFLAHCCFVSCSFCTFDDSERNQISHLEFQIKYDRQQIARGQKPAFS